MIQNKVFNFQFFRKFAGICNGGMVFLIRLKNIRLRIQAKSLVQKPITAVHIFPFTFMKRLVTTAGEFFAIAILHGKSELLCLYRLNIKELHPMPYYFKLLSVLTVIRCSLLPIRSSSRLSKSRFAISPMIFITSS